MIVFSSKEKIKIGFGLVGVIILFLVITYFFESSDNAITKVISGESLKPVYSVDTDEEKIAISFDACWGSERTDKILEVLNEYDVKATFFLVNIWMEDYPDKTEEICEAGHEIGLHSKTHPHFTKLSVEEIKKELKENHDMVKDITGYEAEVFRPPFGDYNSTVIETVNEMGLTAVQWDVDSLDWKENLDGDEIAKRVLERVDSGSIVLFHNDGKNTVEAIKTIIPELQKQGYSIVPVSDLLIDEDWYVDVNGVQRKN